MSDEKALIIRPSAALAQRPAHSLLALRPRQIVPAAGAALALTWGAGKIIQRLWASRQPQPAPRAPASGQRVLIYRASWSVTVLRQRESTND
jgi:hypothetical protein